MASPPDVFTQYSRHATDILATPAFLVTTLLSLFISHVVSVSSFSPVHCLNLNTQTERCTRATCRAHYFSASNTPHVTRYDPLPPSQTQTLPLLLQPDLFRCFWTLYDWSHRMSCFVSVFFSSILCLWESPGGRVPPRLTHVPSGRYFLTPLPVLGSHEGCYWEHS